VANLLLARASVRVREIGIRAALGASRWQLVRQLLVESLVLSALATLVGILLAGWAIGVLKAAMPDGVPRVATIALDVRVIGAAAALSLLTGLLFGLVPALQLSRPDLTSALKDGTRGAGTGGGRQRLRGALVVAEVALAVVLLVGATLFLDSFRALMRIDPGFETANLLTLSIVPRLDRGISTGNALPNYGPQLQEIVERVQQVPGVRHASVITGGMPLGGSMSTTTLRIAGRELTGQDASISVRRVTPDYHRTMAIPLKDGRYLEPADRAGAAPVVLVNESAARKYFPGESAVGKSVNINSAERTIVGVVGDVYQSSLEMEPRTEAYLPLAQHSAVFSELVVRTAGDPYEVLPAVRAASVAVMPDALLRNIRTMDEVISRATAQRRLNMLLLGLFGLLALVIAAVGIYGVMAYVVAQRTREIGVRMALGATRAGVVSMVMRSALVLIGAGLAAGSVAAWFISTAADSFLFRVEARDPRAFGTALAVLAAAALIASLVPARRAASVDPMIALRAE
jgi:putative ABC transport system permease protein